MDIIAVHLVLVVMVVAIATTVVIVATADVWFLGFGAIALITVPVLVFAASRRSLLFSLLLLPLLSLDVICAIATIAVIDAAARGFAVVVMVKFIVSVVFASIV